MGDVGNPQGNNPATKPATPPGKRVIKVADVPKTPLSDQSGVIVKIKRVKSTFLLPVRYALGWDPSRTPSIDGSVIADAMSPRNENMAKVTRPTRVPGNGSPFKLTDLDGKTMPVAPNTHYTLRHLREGYLHLYAGEELGWRIFKVDPHRGSLETVKNTYADPAFLNARQAGEAPDPLSVTNFLNNNMVCVPEGLTVHLAFSDVLWSKEVMHKAEKNTDGFRDRHMRSFTGGKNTGDHRKPLSEAGKWVADDAKGMSKGAFWFSQEPFYNRGSSDLEDVLKRGITSQAALEAGALLALEDPAGIAMDLATSLEARLELWEDSLDPANPPGYSNKWAFQTHEAIETLKGLEFAREERQKIAEWRNLALQGDTGRNGSDLADNDAFLNRWLPKQEPGLQEKVHNELKTARENSWKFPSANYDDDARAKWLYDPKTGTGYLIRRQKFEESIRWPEAKVHVAWCESQRFKAYFTETFDAPDVKTGNGITLTKTLTRCYAGVQLITPCKEHLDRQLDQALVATNVIGRGLALNDRKLMEAQQAKALHKKDTYAYAKEVLNGTLYVAGKVTETAASKDADYWAQYGTQGALASATLLQFFSGIIRPLQTKIMESASRQQTFDCLVSLGILSGAHMIPIRIKGPVYELEGLLEQEVRKAMWQSGAYTQLEVTHATHENYRRVLGVTAKEAAAKAGPEGTVAIMVDQRQLVDMLKRSDPTGVPTTWTEADQQKLTMPLKTYEEAVKPQQQRIAAQQLGKAAPVVLFRTCQGLFQGAAIYESTAEISKQGADPVKVMKLVSNVSGLVTNVCEGLEKVITEVEFSGLRFGAALSEKKAGVRFIGRAGVVLGGALIAVMEYQKGQEEKGKGNIGLGMAHRANAVLSISTVVASSIAWGAASEMGKSFIKKKAMSRLACMAANRLGAEVLTGALVATTATGISELVFFLMLIIDAAIIVMERMKLDTWLQRCCWGNKFKTIRFCNISEDKMMIESIMKMY